MYLLKPVGLVTAFSHYSRHVNVPYYVREEIINKHSSSILFTHFRGLSEL